MVSSSLSLEDIAHLRQFAVLLQTLLYSSHNLRFLVTCVMEYFTLILCTQERSVGVESAVVAWPATAVHVNCYNKPMFGGKGKKKKSCLTRKYIMARQIQSKLLLLDEPSHR